MTRQVLRPFYDAVVIGGGHNGLVAAAYLGQAGKSVLVLEKNEELGGATKSQKVFPDYKAYLSRYSYLVSLLPNQIVDELGLKFETKRRTTASFTPYDSNSKGLVLSNVDVGRSRESFAAMDPSETAWDDFQRFLELELALAKLVWPSFLEPLRAKKDFEKLMRCDLAKEAWKSFVKEPLGHAIERYAQHDALRGLLMTDGKIGVFTHPHDPSLLQNRCFLYHVVGGGNGEWRVPVGGMRALVNALVQVCKRNGVEFATSACADWIGLDDPMHEVGILRDGKIEQVQAEHVLVNAGPRTFAKLLGQPYEAQVENEGSVIKMNMLLTRLPKLRSGIDPHEAFGGSFHIDEGYAQMNAAYETAAKGQIPDPAPGEIYCHTLTDPSILSPELQSKGFHTLTLFGLDMPYRLFEKDHDARKAKVKQLYLEGLDRLCAEPFLDCVARDRHGEPCIEIKTPQDLEAELDLDQGNIFHDAPSWFYAPGEAEVGTWGVETPFDRVFRAGSSALRGGAVSGIPGRNAAMAALQLQNAR